MRVATSYGPSSQVFRDTLARTVLDQGKHLVLITAIESFQQQRTGIKAFEGSQTWTEEVERNIEERGFIKHNEGKHAAAVAGVERNFFKAENQLWYQLGFIKRLGDRSYHPGRGYVFDWSRITDLVKSSNR